MRDDIGAFVKRIFVKQTSVPVTLLLASAVTFVLYQVFFHFSSIIWSKNLHVDPSILSPQIRSWVVAPGQRDGVETYVLYVLVFAVIILTLLSVWLYDRLRSYPKSFLITLPLLALLVYVANRFYLHTGFYPPMATQALGQASHQPMLVVIASLWLIVLVSRWKDKLASLLVAILLIPICFVSTMPISLSDYTYIFAPALRLLDHFPIKDIYFQYDMLPSLLAAVWMKLHIDLNYFQVLGQISFYLLFLGSFFLAKSFFARKELAYYLLAALVLVKVYGLIHDPVLVFQVTPVRLDWWLPALAISLYRGIYSKALGLFLAFLMIIHHTFGLIYAIGYFEIIATLFLVDCLSSKMTRESLRDNLKKHFALTWPNVLMLFFSFIISTILVSGVSLEAVKTYQEIGVGFMPIARMSFYWFFPVLLSAAVVLLMKHRGLLSTNYFHSGLFLISLAIGNSIYFFGRSHENNIINISASLIFALFLLLDLVIHPVTIKGKMPQIGGNVLAVVLPSVVILSIVFYYSFGIASRSHTQWVNLKAHQNIYPMPVTADDLNVSKVKELTNNSEKVYFTGANDFYYYYFGGYVPQGRYSPYLAWVYKKDMQDFMQDLLNNGYYIVSPGATDQEIISGLSYSKSLNQDGFEVVWGGK